MLGEVERWELKPSPQTGGHDGREKPSPQRMIDIIITVRNLSPATQRMLLSKVTSSAAFRLLAGPALVGRGRRDLLAMVSFSSGAEPEKPGRADTAYAAGLRTSAASAPPR